MSVLGVHLAQVVNNTDPDRRGRIKVRCSTLFGNIESANWIDMVAPANYYSIPAVNDKVVLIAENNDARYCHYLGRSFASSTKDGSIQSIVTPADASLASEQVSIVSNAGNYILIDDNTDTITIKADNVIIDGDLLVDGDMEVTGSAEITGECTIGSIAFSTHTHNYSIPQHVAGTGPTGAPNV